MDADMAMPVDIKDRIEIFRDTMGEELTDREMLALLLSFTDCAKHSDALIDALYETFGSYSAIFKASHTELAKVPNISQKVIALIVILGRVYKESLRSHTASVGEYIEDVGDLFYRVMDGSQYEELWAAGFDEHGILVACECILHGTVDTIAAYIAAIADFSSRNRVNIISVAHNHPTLSKLTDNDADANIAYIIGNTLLDFNIQLQNFFIIDDEIRTLEFEPYGELE